MRVLGMGSLAWSPQVPSSKTKVEETEIPHGWQKVPSRKQRLSPWSSPANRLFPSIKHTSQGRLPPMLRKH